MNGENQNIPSGVAFGTTPEQNPAAIPLPENIAAVNGVTEGAEGPAPLSPSAPEEHENLTELKQKLLNQFEYYFSQQNLANDTYLVSQMDSDQYVPIWLLATFNQIKKLTSDIQLITQVLRESPNVQVDSEGKKVRPLHKRCVVILREIPDTTPLQEVEALFSSEHCPPFVSCQFAHNDSWYITFESEDDAQKAYEYLREEVKEFRGHKIMARIKGKTMHHLPIGQQAIPTQPPVKNGFTTPPPQALYDPAAYPPSQARLMYANGAPGHVAASYNHHVLYQTYQQQYYAQVPTWTPSAPGFYDISTVFHVNGLAPQTTYKHNNTYKHNQNRPRKPSRSSVPSETQGGGGSNNGQGNSRPLSSYQGRSHSPLGSNSKSNSSKGPALEGAIPKSSHIHNVVNDAHIANHSASIGLPAMHTESDTYRYGHVPPVGKEVIAPRHRKKKRDEDTLVTNGQSVQTQTREHPRDAQINLGTEAFPPLKDKNLSASNSIVEPPAAAQSSVEPQQGWGENRLADVVKGTAKIRNSNAGGYKESSTGGGDDSPRATSPPQFPASSSNLRQNSISSSTVTSEHKDASNESADIQLSTVTLTPPSSPEKLVPSTQVTQVKCTMADKSTKTDDALLNGDLDLPCPTTTNAATMTTVVPTEAPLRIGAANSTNSTSSKNHIPVHRQDSKSEASRHISVSPPLTALDFLEKSASTFNIRKVKRLPVSGAFHTNLMEPAVEVFQKALRKSEINDPVITVYSNVDGKPYRDANHIRRQLPKQIVKPVKWEQLLHAIYERAPGVHFPRTFEVGPGTSLKAIFKQVNAKAAAECYSIEA